MFVYIAQKMYIIKYMGILNLHKCLSCKNNSELIC